MKKKNLKIKRLAKNNKRSKRKRRVRKLELQKISNNKYLKRRLFH